MTTTSVQVKLTIDEVAHELSVSVATIRNWIKLGRIEKIDKEGRSFIFDRDEILKLKKDISEGKSDRLQSRRNKKMVAGNLIPTEYVSYEPYLIIMDRIITLSNQLKNDDSVKIVLLELSLTFLTIRNKLSAQTSEDISLTELYINESLHIPSTYKLLLNNLVNPKEIKISDEDLSILAKINKLDIPYIHGEDFLGLAYMSLVASRSRKNSGSYYTPSKVVDLIIDQHAEKVKAKKKLKVIDPCCGSGNFLIKVFLLLRDNLQKLGHSIEDAEKEIIEHSLYGYDINDTAVTLSSLNLILLMDSNVEVSPNIVCKNTLLENAPTLFSKEESYDWVVGNPPWGYSFNEQEKNVLKGLYAISGSAVESFALFIECGNNILKDGGMLTYVLPESFLNIKIHAHIRESILRNATIDNICLLDRAFSNVFTTTITLSFEKKKRPKDHKLRVVDSENTIEIEQDRFLQNEFFIFTVNSDDKVFEVIEQIKSYPCAFYLKDKVNAEYALGIVTGDNKNFISSEKGEGKEVILTGKNIYKYNFYPENNYITFNPEAFQQIAPTRLYRAPEKLFYRFINKNLVFSYDNERTLSLNSANILIPKHEKYQVKYVMAILNSRVAQFFHTYSFSALKVLKKHIESLPIPMCSDEDQEKVIGMVDVLLSTENENERNTLYDQLDQIIMNIYGLNEETQNYVNKTLEDISFLSK